MRTFERNDGKPHYRNPDPYYEPEACDLLERWADVIEGMRKVEYSGAGQETVQAPRRAGGTMSECKTCGNEKAQVCPVCTDVEFERIRAEAEQLRARVEDLERKLSNTCDIPLARLQFPDGTVPTSTVECAEGWHREAMRFWTERDAARAAAQAHHNEVVKADARIRELEQQQASDGLLVKRVEGLLADAGVVVDLVEGVEQVTRERDAARARLAKGEVVANIVLSTLIARCDEGWAVIQDAFQVARHDLFRDFISAQPDEEVK